MAGHSKWANIRHRKAAQDARRGKVFTRLIRELTVAARGGGNPSENARLRTAVDKALQANMNRDTIDRAILRGSGGGESDNLEEITYEGYAPGGVAVLVESMTDNRNRTAAAVRHAFSKAGGNLGTGGSVAYLFRRRGEIVFPPGCDANKITERAIELDAEDIQVDGDGSVCVITDAEGFSRVAGGFAESGPEAASSELVMAADTQVEIAGPEQGRKLLKFLEDLEELDDTQNVYTNADMGAVPGANG